MVVKDPLTVVINTSIHSLTVPVSCKSPDSTPILIETAVDVTTVGELEDEDHRKRRPTTGEKTERDN